VVSWPRKDGAPAPRDITEEDFEKRLRRYGISRLPHLAGWFLVHQAEGGIRTTCYPSQAMNRRETLSHLLRVQARAQERAR
jgi:hypothetical protein